MHEGPDGGGGPAQDGVLAVGATTLPPFSFPDTAVGSRGRHLFVDTLHKLLPSFLPPLFSSSPSTKAPLEIGSRIEVAFPELGQAS